MSQCTISCEADLPKFFEIYHIFTKESFICQTSDAGQTQQWLKKLDARDLLVLRISFHHKYTTLPLSINMIWPWFKLHYFPPLKL